MCNCRTHNASINLFDPKVASPLFSICIPPPIVLSLHWHPVPCGISGTCQKLRNNKEPGGVTLFVCFGYLRTTPISKAKLARDYSGITTVSRWPFLLSLFQPACRQRRRMQGNAPSAVNNSKLLIYLARCMKG